MSETTEKKPDAIHLKINDRAVEARKGEMVIEVAGRNGIYIPHYCWHPGLSLAGNCRLCLVEAAMFNPKEGKAIKMPKPVIACQTAVAEGMEVWTESPMAKDCQSGMMEFLLANHPLDCPICDRGGECMLQRYSMGYGVPHSAMVDKKRKFKKPEFDTLIDIERNRCIMCTRCVRFCDEIAGDHVMGVFGRGNDNYIGTFGHGPVSSIFSGNVIDLCPVGCLTSKPYRFRARPWELAQTQSTCVHCAAGCKVTYWTRNGALYRVTPPSRRRFDEFTLNEDTTEFICNIGRFGSDYALQDDRIVRPFVRDAKSGAKRDVPWADALKNAAAALGPGKGNGSAERIASTAILVSPRATLEEGYLVSRIARELLSTNNLDWRLWPATAEAAHAASEAFANADGDMNPSPDVLLVVNGDLKNQVPVTALWIKEAARTKGAKLALLGHHHDAWMAKWASQTVHCAPGSTASRLAALAGIVAGKDTAPAGLSAAERADLEKLAATMKAAKSGLLVYSLEDMAGAFAKDDVRAARMLRAALGDTWKLKPVVTGRNAVGLFAVGAQPDRLPSGSLHDQAAVKRAVEGWKNRMPEKAGLTGPEILAAAADGKIRTLVVFGQDVLADAPDQGLVARALDKVESLIVFDLFPGLATDKATVFLPLAAPWETEGTYADLEGNLARLTQGERPRGECRVGAMALAELGRALGAAWSGLTSVEAVFKELKAFLAPDSPIAYDDLLLDGPGAEFPIRERSTHELPGLARRRGPEDNPGDYQPTFHLRWSEGGRIAPAVEAIPPVDLGKADGLRPVWGPTLLAADPYLDRSSGIEVMRPGPYVELNPADAACLGIQDGDEVVFEIEGVDGDLTLTARVCAGPAPGTVYVPAGLTDVRLGRLDRLPVAKIAKPELVRS